MITAVIPLRYSPTRFYHGTGTDFINQKLCIDRLVNCKSISKIIIVSHTPEYVSNVDPQIDFLKKEYIDNKKVEIVDLRHGNFFFNQSWLLNIGIKKTTTPYFMRIDIDCILQTNFTELFSKNMYNINAGYILKGELFFYGEDSTDWNNIESLENLKKKSKLNPYSHSHIVCLTENIVNIKGYDERFEVWGAEDDDVLQRLKKNKNEDNKAEILKETYWLLHQNHNIFSPSDLSEGEILAKENRFTFLYDKNLNRNKNGWGELEHPWNNHYMENFK